MGKKRNDERQSTMAPYVGQWIHASVPSIGPVVAYVTNYNPGNGMAGMWIYPSSSYEPQYMQLHYRDLAGIRPYYGSIPPYQQAPYLPYSPYPAPYNPYLTDPAQPRSCRNYPKRSQQLACYMGLLPPVE